MKISFLTNTARESAMHLQGNLMAHKWLLSRKLRVNSKMRNRSSSSLGHDLSTEHASDPSHPELADVAGDGSCGSFDYPGEHTLRRTCPHSDTSSHNRAQRSYTGTSKAS